MGRAEYRCVDDTVTQADEPLGAAAGGDEGDIALGIEAPFSKHVAQNAVVDGSEPCQTDAFAFEAGDAGDFYVGKKPAVGVGGGSPVNELRFINVSSVTRQLH